MTHAKRGIITPRRNCLLWAKLLITLCVCKVDSACLQESRVSERYGQGSTFEECKEGPENGGRFACRYRVVNGNFGDSDPFQADEMSHENASFELNLAVDANETFIIGLVRDSQDGNLVFRKIFIACMKNKVDGRWMRLRVDLRLSETPIEPKKIEASDLYTYALYATKTTNGKLCEQPSMRLFLPVRVSDSRRHSRTSLQLAVRNSSCISTGENCTIDAYLRRNSNSLTVEKLNLRTKQSETPHEFLFNLRSSRWNRATVHGVTFSTDQTKVDEIQQWLNNEDASSTLRWTIYDNNVRSIEKLATLTPDLNCTESNPEESQLKPPHVIVESTGESTTIWHIIIYILCSFAVLLVFCSIMWKYWRVLLKAWMRWQTAACDNQGRILFVLAGGVNRHSAAVTTFRRALTTKQATLTFTEVPDGLSGLNPQLVRGCRLLLFVSADARFADFRLGDCRSEQTRWALLTTLTERNRIWGCYLSNCDGARPSPDSPWAKMPAVGIGMEGVMMNGKRREEIATAAARRLVMECGLEGDSFA